MARETEAAHRKAAHGNMRISLSIHSYVDMLFSYVGIPTSRTRRNLAHGAQDVPSLNVFIRATRMKG